MRGKKMIDKENNPVEYLVYFEKYCRDKLKNLRQLLYILNHYNRDKCDRYDNFSYSDFI